MKLGESLIALPGRVVNYAKPRPETAGDLADPVPNSAALAGGIQGFVASGLTGGVGGAIGGYVGVKAGEATNSMGVALGAGALTGAASTAALGLGLLASTHPELVSFGTGTLAAAGAGAIGGAVLWATRKVEKPEPSLGVGVILGDVDRSTPGEGAIRARRAVGGLLLGAGAAAVGSGLLQVASAVGPANLIGPAVLGGFIGAVGTLSGDRRASVRDGVYGGMIAGGVAALITGNPLLVAAGAAGAGIAGRAVKPAGRVVMGSLAGAAAGALAGVTGGPHGMITGAVAGALVAPAGALVGPVVRQVMRNLTVDASVAALNKVTPYLQAHPLNHGQKLALGATMGALVLGPIGRVAGWEVAGIAAGVGAVGGMIQTEMVLRKREKVAKETEFLKSAANIAFGNRLDEATLNPTH